MPYLDDGMTWVDEDTGTPEPIRSQPQPSTTLADAYRNIGKSPQGQDVFEGPDGQLYTGVRKNINSGIYETWDPYTGPRPGGVGGAPGGVAMPPPTVDEATGDGGPSGGQPGFTGGGTLGSLLQPFPGVFNPPARQQLPGAPTFTPPEFVKPPAFSYDPFKAPTAQDVLKDPSYGFRLGEGEQALQQSAAAKGLLNTGGTLKDILKYGQQFASNEYGNIWNRDFNTYQQGVNNALNSYGVNYGTQYADPYRAAYQSATDRFAPQMAEYENQFDATQRNNELDYSHAYDSFLNDYSMWDKQRRFTYDTLADQQRIGLDANR